MEKFSSPGIIFKKSWKFENWKIKQGDLGYILYQQQKVVQTDTCKDKNTNKVSNSWKKAKRSNTDVNRVPAREKTDNATEAVFAELLARQFPPNEEKYQTTQIQEAL